MVFLGIACGVIVGGLVLILLFVGVAITLVDWCSCNKSYSKSAFVRQSWDETTEDFYRSADVGRDSCEIGKQFMLPAGIQGL